MRKVYAIAEVVMSNAPAPARQRKMSQSAKTPGQTRPKDVYNKASLTAATGGSRLHALALADLYCWLVICGCSAHALFDLAGHRKESLLDIAGVLSRSFKEWNAKAVSEFLKNS
jgi:hypothetical protein